MNLDSWANVGIVAAVCLVVMLYNAWRHPEKECWRCSGSGWKRALSFFMRIPVRGLCRRCGGYGWYQRRLSRFFGWDANTHR